MQNLIFALIIVALEGVLVLLLGTVYFFARRSGARPAAEPPEDLKTLAHQLVQAHAAALGQYHSLFEAGAARVPESEAALKKSVAALRAVAAQVASGRVSAANLGQGVLDSYEQILAAWREHVRHAPAPPPPPAAPEPAPDPAPSPAPPPEPLMLSEEEIQAEIRALVPPPPDEPPVESETPVEEEAPAQSGIANGEGLNAIPKQEMESQTLVADSLMDLKGIFGDRNPQIQ